MGLVDLLIGLGIIFVLGGLYLVIFEIQLDMKRCEHCGKTLRQCKLANGTKR